jgi:hypothetical protein
MIHLLVFLLHCATHAGKLVHVHVRNHEKI